MKTYPVLYYEDVGGSGDSSTHF